MVLAEVQSENINVFRIGSADVLQVNITAQSAKADLF